MAALAFIVCSTIRELYDLTDTFVRNGFNFTRSLRYYRTRRRLQLFNYYCRQVWLRELQREQIAAAAAAASHDKGDVIDGPEIKQEMQRTGGIDFAAIEASSEAFESIDNFGVGRGARQATNTNDFLNAERSNFELIDNYYKDDEIEVIDGTELSASFYEYAEALPKYYNDQIGILGEGVSYTVTGRILLNCERFSINFVLNNDQQDVALHINPRLPQNYIVRNTKVEGVWGREEVSSALPFQLRRGDRFSIQVLVTNACFMISVNGHHFAEYNHRLPYRLVSALEVKGDVEQVEMVHSAVDEYPARLPESQARDVRLQVEQTKNEVDPLPADGGDEVDGTHIPKEWRLITIPQKLHLESNSKETESNGRLSTNAGLMLPYYGHLPMQSLVEGRCLKIEGRVRLLPHSFYINLQQGQNIWPHPIIAFHLNPRFSKQSGAMGKAIVCRNSWHNGSWAEEERSELDTNFRPGKTFSLAIVCASDAFEVYVNRQFLTAYKYRVKPDLVDTVYIQGDIKLWDVMLESNPLIKGKNVRIYHNPAYSDDY